MAKTDNQTLRPLVQTLAPFVFVLTEEQGRFVKWLKDEFSGKKRHKFKVWKRSKGLQDIADYTGSWENFSAQSVRPDDSANPNAALMSILAENTPMDRHYYIFLDGHTLLDGRDQMISRRIMDLAEQAHMNRECFKSFIFVSHRLLIPPEMDRMFRVADFDLPDQDLLKHNLEQILSSDHLVKRLSSKIDVGGVIRAMGGMTTYEAEQVTLENLTLNKSLSVEQVRQAKIDIVKKNPLLELMEPNVGFDDIGGMENLKNYLTQRKGAWTDEGKEYGLPPFRGVLSVGLPGNGKSLICKALAKEYGIPLVKFDPAKLFGGQVGASETNMRKALATLERMAPCVAGDTPILMADGTTLKAEEIFERADLGDALDIVTVDPATGKKVPSRIHMMTRKRAGEHGVTTVETQSGRVTVRADHQIWTSEGFKEAKDLEIGDRVRFLRHEYVAGGPLPITCILPEGCRAYLNDDPQNNADGGIRRGRDYITLHEDNLDLPYVKYGVGRGGYTDSYVDAIPPTVCEELAELVGYIDSEGSWNGRSALIYNSDPKLLDRCVEICESLFCYTPTQHFRSEAGTEIRFADGSIYHTTMDSYVLRIDRAFIARTLLNLRDDLLKWGYSYLLPAYLRAFINGDGHIREAMITITQKKPDIKARVMEVLRRLEINVRESDGLNINITGAARVCRLLDIMSRAPSFKGDKVDKVVWPHSKWTFTRGIHASEAVDAVDVEVKKLTHISDPDFVVYDLSCDSPHTYIGAGMIHHNCVAWIDEVEKGLAGMQSSTYSDSGTTARVIGTFLTWMQECEKDVILAATANDVTNLPPELLRRFDEIFFVGLPGHKEREDIFRIHINKVNRNPDDFDLSQLAEHSDRRSGAEIEKAVSDALYTAFCDDKREVTTEDMVEAVKTKPPIIVTMSEALQGIIDWVGKDEETGDGVRARFAHGIGAQVEMTAV